jgi:hypothetical protein
MTTTRFAVLFCVIYLMALGLLLHHTEWRTLYALAGRGDPVRGTVTAVKPQNHGSFMYTYEVGGRNFTGGGSPGDGNPDLDHLRVDQSVIVYYLPDEPSVSCPGIPKLVLRDEIRSAIIFLAGGPFFLLLAVLNYKRIMRKRLQNKEQAERIPRTAGGAPATI